MKCVAIGIARENMLAQDAASSSASPLPLIPAFAMPPARVACATDASVGSRAAEKAAFEVARKFGAKLTFITADPTFIYHAELLASSGGLSYPVFDPQKQHEFLKQKENSVRQHLQQLSDGYAFELVVDSGEPALAILTWLHTKQDTASAGGNGAGNDASSNAAADLLVVGRKQKGAIESFFLGSTASNLLEEAKVPVLVIPDDFGGKFSPDSVLVATDLSSKDSNSPRLASHFARAFNAKCSLFHAFENQDYRPIPAEYFSNVQLYQELSDLILHAHEVKQKHLIRECEKNSSRFDYKFNEQLVEGPVKETILRYVNETKPGLLVIGRFSDRGFLGGMLLGSTARGLAMHAQCPVLLVPHELD